MSITDINTIRYAPIIREQYRQEKRDKARKLQRDKDLNKLAKEVLKLKRLKLI